MNRRTKRERSEIHGFPAFLQQIVILRVAAISFSHDVAGANFIAKENYRENRL